MTTKISTLTCARDIGAPVVIAQNESSLVLSEIATACGAALAVAGYRGSVTFHAQDGNGNPLWTSVVTFTNDLPNGNWLNTFH